MFEVVLVKFHGSYDLDKWDIYQDRYYRIKLNIVGQLRIV